MRKRPFLSALLLWFVASPAMALEVVHVKKVSSAPTIDGMADAVWSSVPTTTVLVRPVPEDLVAINMEKQTGKYAKNWTKSTHTAVSEVEIRAVHTDNEIFFLARWRDDTRDDQHKPWKWEGSKESGEYRTGPEREDRISFRFPIRGPFTANMLSDVESVVDVWQWKAARTNPIGIIHDKSHTYSRIEPKGQFSTHYTVGGSPIYVSRPGDGNVSPYETNKVDPFTHQGDVVANYIPVTPDHPDALDVRAKGIWKDGYWTVEIGRKLDTGHADTDTVFDPLSETAMAVAVFDHVGDHLHAVSQVIQVSFSPPDGGWAQK